MDDLVISCTGVGKRYSEGSTSLEVLKNLDLVVRAGDTVAITGTSGCGKSTLLNLLGGLDTLSVGEILIKGRNLQSMSDTEACRWRNQQLGFVYQFHHLLNEFSAVENVAMPLLIGGAAMGEARSKATELLRKVGLEARLAHRPAALSGGERQRVAIARALVSHPACVLMDEPTGNLDPHTAGQVLDLLEDLNREFQISFVVVTHDRGIAARMQRRLSLVDGQLQESR